MDARLREQIKQIKIYTKRLMQSSLSGDYSSAFKGSGLEFDHIREYQPGDDVRSIDWNNSAKMHKIMVKEFIEERDRTVILAIDTSRSLDYGSGDETKKEMLAKVAASLAFVAENNKDKVGALFFSDRVERWYAPTRGRSHLGNIVQNIFSLQPQGKRTNISQALRFLIHLKKKNAIVFFISDWIDRTSSYEHLLKVARYQYDFVGIRLLDTCEKKLPSVGICNFYDPETEEVITVDLGRGSSLKTINNLVEKHQYEQKKMFEKYQIGLLDLEASQPFINKMISFFHQRTRRQI